ncbi:hypothetical protein ACPCUX_03725 [Cellulosimicrobium sp. AB352]|uniref:hypothetical protein n=1 Tax=Cellulosimicrobium sp. AB352 TaxID=3413281 RepID=UPI003C17203D
MNVRKLLRVGTTGVLVAVLVGTGLVSATAAPVAASTTEDDEIAVGDGEYMPLDYTGLDPVAEDYTLAVPGGDGLTVQRFDPKAIPLLPPRGGTEPTLPSPQATWAACGVFDKNTKLVRTFQRVARAGFSSGKSYLRCGSPSWGLRHVADRHRTQWEMLAMMGGSSSWRTFTDWAINEALRSPAHVWYESKNDTYVYKTKIQIRDRSDRVRAVKYAYVVVARVSKNIITTYPASS